MVSKASDDLPEPDRPVITISRSRGRSRSMLFRVLVRAPRMRMVSIAIGGGDLGHVGGGRRRIAAEPESVTSPRFGGKWRKLPACRIENGRAYRRGRVCQYVSLPVVADRITTKKQ